MQTTQVRFLPGAPFLNRCPVNGHLKVCAGLGMNAVAEDTRRLRLDCLLRRGAHRLPHKISRQTHWVQAGLQNQPRSVRFVRLVPFAGEAEKNRRVSHKHIVAGLSPAAGTKFITPCSC